MTDDMFYLVPAGVLIFLLGVATGVGWGALWATWRRTPGQLPYTEATGRPLSGPLPYKVGEQIPIEDLIRSAKRRTIVKQGEQEVPTGSLGTKVGDQLGPDV